MPGAIVSSIAGSLVSAGASKLLGGSSSKSKSTSGKVIPAFTSGGVTNSYDKSGRMILSNTPERQNLVNTISGNYTDQSNKVQSIYSDYSTALNSGVQSLNDQLGLVKPGYGALTDAVVKSILEQGQQRTSDLRSSLAKRRVLGSSFGDSALNQQSLDTSQAVAQAKAASFLQELDATNQLITQKYNMQTQGLEALNSLTSQIFNLRNASSQAQLDELNTLLNTANGLISGAMQQEQANARLEAELAAKSAAARGRTLNDIWSPTINQIGTEVGNWAGGVFS